MRNMQILFWTVSLLLLPGCFNSYTHSLCSGKDMVNLDSYQGTYSRYMNMFGQQIEDGTVEFKLGSSQGRYSLVDEYGDIIYEDMVSCKVGDQILLELALETDSNDFLFSSILVDIDLNNNFELNLSELDMELLSQDNISTIELAPDASYGLGDLLIAVENQSLTGEETLKYLVKPGVMQISK